MRVRLRFTAPSRQGFFHQPALAALLRSLAMGALADEPRIWLDAPDSGRVPFRAGDGYGLHLYACAGAERVLDALVAALRQLPAVPLPAERERLRFGPNLLLVGAEDLFTGQPFERAEGLFGYDSAALDRETGFWAQAPAIRLRFTSPARILLPKDEREGLTGEARFVRDRGQLTGDLLGLRLHDTFAGLLKRTGLQADRRGPSRLAVTGDDVAWIDAGYYGPDGDANPMGGVLGALDLNGHEDTAALPLLVLGQYTGIGQRRGFGWGRYRLEAPDGRGTTAPRRYSLGVLARASEEANVDLAYRTIRANQLQRNAAESALRQLDGDGTYSAADQLLAGLAGALARGEYRPPALQGSVLRQPGKAPRPLAVPPFADRVAQRAVLQVLTEDFEPLFSSGSFGYRRGYSRQGARDRLQSLYRQGYRWFYETDIDDFFDTVSHRHLDTRLRSLLTDDPVVDLIMAWVAAPVRYRGEEIERPAGLPQGAPLSPLLANLLLDDFDADLEAHGLRLVRFADDLVVVCKSREEAESAARRVDASLADLGLKVNPDKSRVGSFDDGLRFLGYTFVGDLAVDGPSARESHHALPLRAEDVPPRSWLGRLVQRNPRALEAVNAPETGGATPVAQKAPPPEKSFVELPTAAAAAGEHGCHLVVVSEGSRLSTLQGHLRVARADGHVTDVPWSALAGVLVLGWQTVTTPALVAALKARVPIHFASRTGWFLGTLAAENPGPEGHGLWLRQQARFADPAFALGLAREVVAARIHNQLEVVRQRARGRQDFLQVTSAIERLVTEASSAETGEQLLGMEGKAGQLYFSVLQELGAKELGFEWRVKKKDVVRDPVNAMLNLGYGLLRHHAESVLRAAGLLPWVGFYHQPHGRHATLASDLMEPFRHVVERAVLTLVNRGQLRPDDYTVDDEAGCQLGSRIRRVFLGGLSERFATPVEDATSGLRGSVPEHLWHMSRRLVGVLSGRDAPFTAFRIR